MVVVDRYRGHEADPLGLVGIDVAPGEHDLRSPRRPDRARKEVADPELRGGQPVGDTCGAEVARSASAIRMSAARLKQKPPPIAGPLTAAITGWCMRLTARITSSRSSIERSAIDDLVKARDVRDRSRILQVGTRSRTRGRHRSGRRHAVELSALTSSRASRRGIITSKAIAFIRSGRLSVTRATSVPRLVHEDERHRYTPNR